MGYLIRQGGKIIAKVYEQILLFVKRVQLEKYDYIMLSHCSICFPRSKSYNGPKIRHIS